LAGEEEMPDPLFREEKMIAPKDDRQISSGPCGDKSRIFQAITTQTLKSGIGNGTEAPLVCRICGR